MANIRPLEDKIVVQASEAGDHHRVRHRHPRHGQGEAPGGQGLAVGPGRVDDNGNRVPLDVSVGDVVIYSKYGGTEVKYDGEEYLILSARDVLAVVNWPKVGPVPLIQPPPRRSVDRTGRRGGCRRGSTPPTTSFHEGKAFMPKQISFDETARRALERG